MTTGKFTQVATTLTVVSNDWTDVTVVITTTRPESGTFVERENLAIDSIGH